MSNRSGFPFAAWERIKAFLFMPVLGGRLAQREGRALKRPDPSIDPRTRMLPMDDESQPLDYYTVANFWAAEKLRSKKLMSLVIEGDEAAPFIIEDRHFPGSMSCQFGRWMRFVRVEPSKEKPLEDLRMWHEVWHEAARSMFDMVNQGRYEEVQEAFRKRTGSYFYAQRKIDRLISMMWLPPKAAGAAEQSHQAVSA